MTSRYDLLLESLHETNVIALQIFGFAVAVLIAWHVLGWLPPAWVKPIRNVYLGILLVVNIFLLVFQSV